MLVLVALTACGLLPRRHAPADLFLARLSPPIVSDAAQAEFALRNTSGGPLVVPHPSDAFLLVSGASGEGRVLQCRTPPAPGDDVQFIRLPPGGEIRVLVDLLARCDPGAERDFRFVIRFAVPAEIRTRPGGRSSWIGATEPAHVQVNDVQ